MYTTFGIISLSPLSLADKRDYHDTRSKKPGHELVAPRNWLKPLFAAANGFMDNRSDSIFRTFKDITSLWEYHICTLNNEKLL